MSTDGGQGELIERATAGDQKALQQLLWTHYPGLLRHIAPKLDGDLQRLVDVNDVIQETFIRAIRDIDNCQARSDESFAAWLKVIADHRLRDIIRGLYRQKRGGNRRPATAPAGGSASSLVQLVDLIPDRGATASKVIARNEVIKAMQVGIAGLPDDQREAVRLRYLEGRSIEETAGKMGRTTAAVNGLVRRAKEALRQVLDRSSVWLSRK
jgi:RNA polymerase sigma-70 factor (ECF subfamily)